MGRSCEYVDRGDGGGDPGPEGRIVCNIQVYSFNRRHKICNFMPVRGGLELSAFISSSYDSNNSTKHWTPRLLFLRGCVHSKMGFLHRLCISKFS